MKKFLEEFKEFAFKGNVIDMSVGVVIGAAFTAIVTALTENIINPLIASLGGTEVGLVTPIGETGQVINWGAFITAVLNFLITAFVLFLIVKSINKMRAAVEEPVVEEAPAKSDELVTLEEIRDLLKKQ